MNLAAVNISAENDFFLKIVKYIEIVIIPHNLLSSPDYYIILSSIIWIINLVHIILTILVFILFCRKIVIKLLFLIISIINYVLYYYLIGPIIYLAIFGTFCKNNLNEITNSECHSDKKYLAFTALNFIFGFYSFIIIQFFGLYNNQIGSIPDSNVKNRVNCDYNIYSANAKLVVYIIAYFYIKYSKDSVIFKYIYQVYIFLSCFFLSIYTFKRVFYYNKKINTIIEYCWFFDTWFALCILLKICFNIKDITLFLAFGWILIVCIFSYNNLYSHYRIITQIDILNEQNLIHIEKFKTTLLEFYESNRYELIGNALEEQFRTHHALAIHAQ